MNNKPKPPGNNEGGKVWLITGISREFGAAGGIGRVVAKRLASHSFGVAVHYSGNPAKAEAVVAEIKDAGGKANLVRQCKIYGSPV
jgi:NAD(P)-dependent dehydrogenase (short-subunit alcohol dehydrogenase family)